MTSVEGYFYRTNTYIQLTYQEDRITKIENREDIPFEKRQSQILTPSFFDLQVNGYGGIDFNDITTTPEDILQVTQLLNSKGTRKYLPTVITNSVENISLLVKTIAAAVEKYDACRKAIAGIHLEGPFLSKEDGPRGAHPLKDICPPDVSLIQRWIEDSKDLIKILTLSPEYDSAFETIAFCRQHGIKVAIGHTAANAEQIAKAVSYGAELSTHLGNGSHTMMPRHNNYIWDQLANDSLACSLIGDGFHLPKPVLKCFLRLKADKAMLISDSSTIAGLAPGTYKTHIGGTVVLTSENRLCMAENQDLLAGSAATLFDEIAFLQKNSIISLGDSIIMSAVRPAQFLRQDVDLVVGNAADFLIMENSPAGLQLQTIIQDGENLVYR